MNAMLSMPDFFNSYKDEIEHELQKIISDSAGFPYNMLRYHMGWQDMQGYYNSHRSSKFIRPIICLLSYQATGHLYSQILPAAAALELIHNFSLIHDDIEDASAERHNRPSLWQQWGQPQAINAGDAMFALAYIALLKLRQSKVTEGKILEAAQMLSRACLDLCEGQALDIAYENQLDVTIEDYLDMVTKKTAALVATSSALGSYLGNADDKIVNCFYQFGKEMGLAFQIVDDILGIWGVEENTGKPTKNDILQKKKTLPVIYGLRCSKVEERETLVKLYSQRFMHDSDVAQVLVALDRLGAKNYSYKLAQHYYHQALAHLDIIEYKLGQQSYLRDMACFLTKRNN
ncbi:MAG: polyprenyl synthetase family protein [Dehalococcoidia bacterium]|nr:polyprenyl synthetase family protein [Dehalococcoidia bacterium]